MSDNPTPEEMVRVCRHIAKMANAMAWGSGEPGLEIAGTTVSVCATDPAFAARFAEHGNEAIIDSERGVYDAMMNGCLSYRTKDGRILTPDEARELSGVTEQ